MTTWEKAKVDFWLMPELLLGGALSREGCSYDGRGQGFMRVARMAVGLYMLEKIRM